jgi:hypothetical protein
MTIISKQLNAVHDSASSYLTAARYNKICGNLRSLIHRLSLLPAQDPFRQQKETEMLNKLYDMGILGTSGCLGDARGLLIVQKLDPSHLRLRTK